MPAHPSTAHEPPNRLEQDREQKHKHEHSPKGHSHHDHSRHDHSHHHAPASFDRAFAIGIALNTAFVATEAIYGLRAHSLALVADAVHNLGDVLGLVLAWAGSMLARRQPTERRTYGLRRFSVLAALINAGVLLITVGAIAVEAIQRLRQPGQIATGTVMVIATIGVVINLVTALGFLRGRHGDLNIRGAYLHMLGDAAVSAGVVVAALLIKTTGLGVLDPMVSLAIAAIIAWSTWSLARDSVNLALDAVPANIDPAAVRAHLLTLDGVTEVHDLHIWAMGTTDVALTAHLLRPCACGEDALLSSATRQLSERFGIGHVTLQLERGHGDYPCDQARPGAL